MATIKLSKDRIAELIKSQRELHDLLAEFDKAESCGIDCQAYRQVHQEAAEQISALLQHYGK